MAKVEQVDQGELDPQVPGGSDEIIFVIPGDPDRWATCTVDQLKGALGLPAVNNFSATEAPAVGDDSAAGYEVGSIWIDTVSKEVYRCLDASPGAAVWKETTLEPGELAPVALSGSAEDLSGLAPVALSGAAGDLSGLAPVALSGAAGDLSGLAAVALSGSALDLSGLASVALSGSAVHLSGLASVAITNSYLSLSNRPLIRQGSADFFLFELGNEVIDIATVCGHSLQKIDECGGIIRGYITINAGILWDDLRVGFAAGNFLGAYLGDFKTSVQALSEVVLPLNFANPRFLFECRIFPGAFSESLLIEIRLESATAGYDWGGEVGGGTDPGTGGGTGGGTGTGTSGGTGTGTSGGTGTGTSGGTGTGTSGGTGGGTGTGGGGAADGGAEQEGAGLVILRPGQSLSLQTAAVEKLIFLSTNTWEIGVNSLEVSLVGGLMYPELS